MGLHVGELAWVGLRRALVLAVALVIGLSAAAHANRPFFPGSRASNPESAVRFSDPSVSRVIYYELSSRAPVQWFAVESERPQELRIQVGVPAGVSRVAAAPGIVLFGPGFAGRPDGLSIDPPQGAGGVALALRGGPERFFEPVTGTESVILGEASVELPEAGTYYAAVYDAQGGEGKLWVGLGQREAFTWRDIPRFPGWIRKARDFHELPGWPRWMWIGGAASLGVVAALGFWVVRRLLRVT